MMLFAGGRDPFEEARQAAADRQSAWDGMKEDLPALGLAFGLSMLARNNGTRSVGQLIGQGGADALGAYAAWKTMEDLKRRRAMEDERRREDQEWRRQQDVLRNGLAQRRLDMDAEQLAFRQEMERRRLGLAGSRE